MDVHMDERDSMVSDNMIHTKDKDHMLNSIKLYANYPEHKELSATHTLGKVVLDEKMDLGELVKILCDTGALSANYVAENLIKKLKNRINKEQFFGTKCKVTLADSRTTKNITSGVKLQLVLKDNDAKKYVYTGDFFILDMAKNDIILGLPALTGKLYPFMQELLRKANSDTKKKQLQSEELHALDLKVDRTNIKDLKRPFLKPSVEAAPEDSETPLPVNFGDALTFLGKPRAEAIADFESLIEKHVSQEMKDSCDIVRYLKEDALNVFVPDEWSGVKGIPPLKLKWKDTLPGSMKPKARPINPKLWEASEKEFTRLCGYFYGASRSPWASCLVVAPKATPPYIRFCGDYVQINKHMETGHYTIPNVKHELGKIIKYPIYLDIDLTNAFHQIPLDEDTASKLSIQTPWGQYQPKFMPEGIAPATGVLQETVRKIFGDCDEWAIVIFDNMLVLAEDMADGFEKFKKVVNKCKESNIKLKMAKSWLGFRQTDFFGYLCKHKTFGVHPDKKEALSQIPFPTTTHKARSLLGKGVFFSGFVPSYSDLTAHLPDMTKKTFNWNKSKWKHDYLAEFNAFIKGLQDASEVFYADYSLDWILRTDASEIGVGAVLLQVKKLEDGKVQFQPISFVSKKFSDPATRWSTIEQEAYGIYYAVKKLGYYLVGKQFVIETDHNNLLWMESSEVPKIIRWRIFLQAFNFMIRHIRGKDNVIADWFSREFAEHQVSSLEHATLNQDSYSTQDIEEDDYGECNIFEYLSADRDTDHLVSEQEHPLCNLYPEADRPNTSVGDKPAKLSQQDCLLSVHNGKVGHMGERTTWLRLNKEFPGHNIPFKLVAEFVAACPNCNKTRLGMRDALVPIIRTLKPPKTRSAIGIDALEITPHSKEGYTHLNVIVNLFTKFVALYPVKGVTALNLARCVWSYWCRFGHTDMVITDQGPDLNSHLFQELTSYMGMRHTFSIVDKHANGVERINGEIVRHLRALVYDDSIDGIRQDIFEDPTKIDSVAYILNSEKSSETGYTPFELTYGSLSQPYLEMAKGELKEKAHNFMVNLDADLKSMQDKSRIYQDSLIAGRRDKGVPPDQHNRYQPGDFVLFDKGSKVTPKMAHRYLGPYSVKNHVDNDVTVQHMATGEIKKFDVQDLKIYGGTLEQAEAMARRDSDQHVIKEITDFQGDPEVRTTLSFTVTFMDGDVREVPYSTDLFESIPYEDFCNSRKYLKHLLHKTSAAKEFIKEKKATPIKDLVQGDDVYLDIRVYGHGWYRELKLPDAHTTTYVTKMRITKLRGKVIHVLDPISGDKLNMDSYGAYCWLHKEFDPSSMVLIDQNFRQQYPQYQAS